MLNINRRKQAVLFSIVLLILVVFISSAPEPARRSGNSLDNGVKIGTLEIPAVLVKGGSFEMGAAGEESADDAQPVHMVTLTDFYLSTTEVTIGQYKEYCRQTGKAMPEQDPETNDSYPVAFVTWYEAFEFCKWTGGCLPTEAQWEYAARGGGMDFKYPTGSAIDHSQANYTGTGQADKWKRVAPVAKFPPNNLGIHDLAGNLYEWCQDYYRSDYYQNSGMINPAGPATSLFKVIRGGSWYHDKNEMRTTYRFRYMPVARLSFVGFRVAWDPSKAHIAQ